jgi:hypothetical protein
MQPSSCMQQLFGALLKSARCPRAREGVCHSDFHGGNCHIEGEPAERRVAVWRMSWNEAIGAAIAASRKGAHDAYQIGT